MVIEFSSQPIDAVIL